jgi:hypothetical protein
MQSKGEEESVGRRNNNDYCFSYVIFFAAELAEIGGGYLVWL